MTEHHAEALRRPVPFQLEIWRSLHENSLRFLELRPWNHSTIPTSSAYWIQVRPDGMTAAY